MKRILILFVFIISTKFYADTPIVIKHDFENITLYISVPSYREDLNKGLIIGEYLKILANELNYTDSIQVFLDMKTGSASYKFYNEKYISLHSRADNFDLCSNLKLIEFAIRHKKLNIDSKIGSSDEILNMKHSKTIETVLQQKIERPNFVEQLKSRSFISYFYQDDKYHIYNKLTNEILLVEKDIFLFFTMFSSRPLIFSDNKKFIYFDNKNNVLQNHLGNEYELQGKNPVTQINPNYIIFNTYTSDLSDQITILQLSKNRIINIFE